MREGFGRGRVGRWLRVWGCAWSADVHVWSGGSTPAWQCSASCCRCTLCAHGVEGVVRAVLQRLALFWMEGECKIWSQRCCATFTVVIASKEDNSSVSAFQTGLLPAYIACSSCPAQKLSAQLNTVHTHASTQATHTSTGALACTTHPSCCA